LVVAATGTGKTVIAAFDFKKYFKKNRSANFLFVAHREEILKQARYTFRQILRDGDFGELWVGEFEPKRYNHLFVSIQTLNSRINQISLEANFYDYIIIDEVHHSAAKSYQKLLERFNPQLLVGLTATPERHDADDITKYFGHSISAEIRLPEALNRRLLCPFQYFGISDQTDISTASWRKGRYDIGDLEKIYSEDKRRVGDIIRNCDKYLKDPCDVRALCFCVSKKHAMFMADQFSQSNLRAAFLTSDNSNQRNEIVQKFRRKEINYLFVVDIFNEGLDIPEIDTLLFLRPTESLTVFLQQLGRGLRLHESKEYLTVLDFIGQGHVEYSFEHKFRGMLGRTHTKVIDEIENEFPHLPLGCSIVLERMAKEIILKSVSQNIKGGKNKIVSAIRKFSDEYDIECSLKNFCEFKEISLKKIYDTDLLWFELLDLSRNQKIVENKNHRILAKVMATTWLSTDSLSYFTFIVNNVSDGFISVIGEDQNQWLLMLYYDLFDEAPGVDDFNKLKEFLSNFFTDEKVKKEVQDFFSLRLIQLGAIEKHFTLSFVTALRLHGRYTRNQILVAMEKSSLSKKYSSREGVFVVHEKNIELLFVTLDKTDGKYNPSTMYHDYFVNERLFHWQSQNATAPNSKKGMSYVNHGTERKMILLFVREATCDENGLTMAFVFCGSLTYKSHTGTKPMNIIWELNQLPPALLLSEGRKLAVG